MFLPPLLYAAAGQTSWPDFQAAPRPIGLLALGCVLFTTTLVATAHYGLPGQPRSEEPAAPLMTFQQLQEAIIQLERAQLAWLRREAEIGEQGLRKVENELDLEEARLALDKVWGYVTYYCSSHYHSSDLFPN